MNYRYFRSETGTSGGWRRKAQFGVKMNYQYFRSETRTFGGWRRKAQFGVKINYRYYRWSLTGNTGRCLFRI
jgi:hypothetical protein